LGRTAVRSCSPLQGSAFALPLLLNLIPMFVVYVLYSIKFNKIYVGYTSDLPNRFLSHNELATKGYTIRYRPWVIIHTEEFSTKTEAIIREKQLKNATGRQFIWDIIKNRGNSSR
jgi:putative endonuclease